MTNQSYQANEIYQVLATEHLFEEDIKHSRFITVFFPCANPEAFKQKLTELKVTYPNATHYCQAFVCGQPSQQPILGFSDDGEPSGSAGKPMLAVLQGANIGDIGVVVIRYYGGIKLGTGGLVKAYTSGMKQSVPQLITATQLVRFPASLSCDYHQLRDVEHLLQQYSAALINKQFDQQISLEFLLAKSQQTEFQLQLAALTQGRVQAQFAE